jgi:aminomethyltransferase
MLSELVTQLRRTPLFEEHVQLGAHLVPFGGWEMPLQYSSIKEEHLAVRQAAGLFDLSHMGEVVVRGPQAQAAVQRLVTNDIARLRPGRAQYNLLCRPDGGILDDLLVYALPDGAYLLVVNASNQGKDCDWIREQAPRGADVRDEGAETALIGVQGPRAIALLSTLTTTQLEAIRYYAFADGQVAAIPCRLSRTGYTGEDGFELFCDAAQARSLWTALLEAGRDVGLKPAGLGARDTLRLEAGMRLYGNDLDVDTNPFEANLAWTVKLDKGDFIGREALQRAKERGIKRLCIGLRLLERGIPRHGYPVQRDGRAVGIVSSGNVGFSLGHPIALAYVETSAAPTGTQLTVEIRGAQVPAEVVDLPFYRRPDPK